MKKYFTLLLASGLACATESFESVAAGALSSVPAEYGTLTADAGHAVVLQKLARTGKNTLHIQGGQNRAVRMQLNKPSSMDSRLELWIQRWTSNGSFDFRIIAETPSGDVELARETKLRAGGYDLRLSVTIPAGCKAIKLVCTSAPKGGVLVDDMELITGAMQVATAELLPVGTWIPG